MQPSRISSAARRKALTPHLISYLHAGGVQVYTWTSDTTAIDVLANWRATYNASVDALVTNQPSAALAAC